VECKLCLKTFDNKATLIQHCHSHHFICDKKPCSKKHVVLGTARSFKQHLIIHHNFKENEKIRLKAYFYVAIPKQYKKRRKILTNSLKIGEKPLIKQHIWKKELKQAMKSSDVFVTKLKRRIYKPQLDYIPPKSTCITKNAGIKRLVGRVEQESSKIKYDTAFVLGNFTNMILKENWYKKKNCSRRISNVKENMSFHKEKRSIRSQRKFTIRKICV